MGGIIQKIDSGEMNAWYSCIFIRQGLCSPGLGFSYSLWQNMFGPGWGSVRRRTLHHCLIARDPDARISLKAPNEER